MNRTSSKASFLLSSRYWFLDAHLNHSTILNTEPKWHLFSFPILPKLSTIIVGQRIRNSDFSKLWFSNSPSITENQSKPLTINLGAKLFYVFVAIFSTNVSTVCLLWHELYIYENNFNIKGKFLISGQNCNLVLMCSQKVKPWKLSNQGIQGKGFI